jgi:hypothetical protein
VCSSRQHWYMLLLNSVNSQVGAVNSVSGFGKAPARTPPPRFRSGRGEPETRGNAALAAAVADQVPVAVHFRVLRWRVFHTQWVVTPQRRRNSAITISRILSLHPAPLRVGTVRLVVPELRQQRHLGRPRRDLLAKLVPHGLVPDRVGKVADQDCGGES